MLGGVSRTRFDRTGKKFQPRYREFEDKKGRDLSGSK